MSDSEPNDRPFLSHTRIDSPRTPRKNEAFITNIANDPYSGSLLFYKTAKTLGFDLDIDDVAQDMDGKPTSDKVIVAGSMEARDIIRQVNQFSYRNTTISALNHYTEIGFSRKILEYIQNSDKNSLLTTESTKKQNLPKLVLQGYFMAAYERAKEKTPLHSQPEAQAYYDELEAQHVRPITPEQIGGLIAVEIRKTLKEHPGLAPEGYEEINIQEVPQE